MGAIREWKTFTLGARVLDGQYLPLRHAKSIFSQLKQHIQYKSATANYVHQYMIHLASPIQINRAG